MSEISLYREAWVEFKRHFRDLLPWILGFSALLTFCEFSITRSQIQTLGDLWSSMQSGDVENIANLLNNNQGTSAAQTANMFSYVVDCGAFLCFIRLYLKWESIALSGPKEIIQAGWTIIKKHWWRLVWNYLCLGTTIALLFLAALFLTIGVLYSVLSIQTNSVVFVGCISLLIALFEATNLALTSIYICSACSVLVQEPKKPV